MKFSKLVGIKEKEWTIDGKIGKNKTYYFTSHDSEQNGETIQGVVNHAYTVNPDEEMYYADMLINNEYLLLLGEAKKSGKIPLDGALTKDMKPVMFVNQPQKS